MNLETLSKLSKLCTIIIGIGFLGTIITSIIGLAHKAMPPILAIILIIFTGLLFGSAIYSDIKNKRWQDGYKL